MSKPGFSFGLKKASPSKPAPTRPKPATFGGDSDYDDDDEDEVESRGFLGSNIKAKKKAAIITEIDAFDRLATSFATAEDDDDDKKKKKKSRLGGEVPPPPRKSKSVAAAQFGDLSSALASRKYAEAAEGADPSIYEYDAVYDSLKLPVKKKDEDKEAPAAEEKRPRYFGALQKAADIRERDRQIAEEKRLKRERDAEGDAFADKENFVTEAYKRQQEENRWLEEEEKRREEAESKKNKNRGLADFYKQMLDRGEEEHAARVKAVEEHKNAAAAVAGQIEPAVPEEEDTMKSATERAKEINAMGGSIIVNDDGEVVDMRQLLRGGLNVAPKKKIEVQQKKARQATRSGSTGSGGAQIRGVFATGGKHAMRERQTRMLEAQLEETLKRSREEEEQEKAKVELIAKSRKTEADISSAKERYLARKRAAEEAKKDGLVEAS
ncbi:coiled-coil domain-containing protein 55-domain containing protein [Podospora didyma]|uniref:Coiled-coil domain-containing protein 55-domain containing protein n=1 Tax=Podospora didyma TaxID=330526 RepID=A0AAE0KG24_9PEZI|nr:coiled-coil domain-containing protein 55-domain containing protein [Podospora didyma]